MFRRVMAMLSRAIEKFRIQVGAIRHIGALRRLKTTDRDELLDSWSSHPGGNVDNKHEPITAYRAAVRIEWDLVKLRRYRIHVTIHDDHIHVDTNEMSGWDSGSVFYRVSEDAFLAHSWYHGR